MTSPGRGAREIRREFKTKELVMKRYTIAALLAAGLFTVPALTGCDDKDTQERKVEITTPDGKKVEQKVTTETDDDGDMKAKQKTTVDGETVDEKKIEVEVDKD
jgi:hypothetical protein